MTWLPLLLFAAFPAWQSSLEVVLPTGYEGVISEYKNSNFSQQLIPGDEGLLIKIESSKISTEKISYRVMPNDDAIEALAPDLQAVVYSMFQQAFTVDYYLRNIRYFLQGFSYSEDDSPQDAEVVLRSHHGHCVGFTNVVQLLLRCANIKSQIVRGFYLRQVGQTAQPVSHRWLEIQLSKTLRFFFDPQYADFSVNYIVANENVSFDRIPKFNGLVIKRKKVLSDE